jgi:hypothetical protein
MAACLGDPARTAMAATVEQRPRLE